MITAFWAVGIDLLVVLWESVTEMRIKANSWLLNPNSPSFQLGKLPSSNFCFEDE